MAVDVEPKQEGEAGMGKLLGACSGRLSDMRMGASLAVGEDEADMGKLLGTYSRHPSDMGIGDDPVSSAVGVAPEEEGKDGLSRPFGCMLLTLF